MSYGVDRLNEAKEAVDMDAVWAEYRERHNVGRR
jgi:hypothetical protein